MLARLRVSVPDRPGSLGLVATTVGSAGADITRVEVLDNEGGRAVDDVFAAVRDQAHLQRVRERLAGTPGVEVLGVQCPAPPSTGHAELELVSQVVGRPASARQTLVDGAPTALGVDWAVLLAWGQDGSAGDVVASSTGWPGPGVVTVTAALRLTTLRLTPTGGDRPYGGAALVPVTGTSLGLVVVREDGPEIHRSELWRLEQIGDLVGAVLTRA